MERRGDEVHIDTDEARAGGTQNVVRWILLGGLLLVIVCFAIIVMVGSASQSENEDDQTLKVDAQDQIRAEDANRSTDGIVSDDADQIRNAPQDAGQVPPGRVAN